MKKLIFLLIFLPSLCFAQKEANIWYFGNGAGLDFNGGAPVPLIDGQLSTLEGCASIADRNTGQLLFYTDGITVWDANHNMMPNGNWLGGNPSSTQSGIIVPAPGNPDLYYIFTIPVTASPVGMQYSEVDMTLNGGLGDINANKSIFITASVTEKLTAVRHANGTDIWVLTHMWNSDAFHAYLVTSGGVTMTPVISNVGSQHTGGVFNTIGYLKTSPDGSKIALAVDHDGDFAEVFDFDNATGVVTNPITFYMDNPYGVEFSPDNTKLYVSTESSPHFLYQYDLSAGTPADVIASETVISNGIDFLGALQLGPDGKMYISRNSNSFLAVINNPNGLGAACNYVQNGVNLSGRVGWLGLPNFVTTFLNVDTVSFSSSGFCFGDSTYFTNTSSGNFNSSSWDFNDPGSGGNNTSSLTDPVHLFTAPGTYDVTLVITDNLSSDTIVNTITINPSPTVDLGNDTTICAGNVVVLDAQNPGGTYSWSTGATTPTINVNAIGQYWVQVTDTNGCVGTDTINITPGALDIDLGADFTYCTADNPLLDAGAGISYTYLWSTNATSQTINVTTPGDYWVEVSDGICVGGDTISATPGALNIDLGTDFTYCTADNPVLDAGAGTAYTYLWSTNATSQTINVVTPGDYWVEVSDGVCIGSDTVNASPGVLNIDLGPDQLLCDMAAITLDASAGVAYVYDWSTNATMQTIGVDTSGTYWVEVNDGVCTGTDTVSVLYDIVTVELDNDTTLCAGDVVMLDAQNPGATYLWSIGAITQTINVLTDGIYWVEVTNANGCIGTDTVNVTPGTLDIDLGTDFIYCTADNPVLDAGAGAAYTYLWSTNATSQTINVTTPGDYWVEVSDGICVGSDTVNASPGVLNIDLGSDQLLCDTATITLDAGAGVAYVYDWSTNATTQTIGVNTSGTYWVEVNDGVCTGTDTVSVLYDIPVVDLGNDTTICAGDVVVLDAGPFNSYTWSTGATTQTINANIIGQYWVQVADTNGCVVTDTVNITPDVLDLDLGADFTYCTADNPLLDAGTGVSYTYLWSTNATSQTINVTTPGDYWVEVSDGICVGSDTVNASPGVLNIDLGLDQLLCDTATITLDAGAGVAYVYDWSTNATTQTIGVNTSGTYWVEVNDGVCMGTDTVSVSYGVLTIYLGNDTTICAGDVVVLDAGPFNSYTWSTGATTPTISVNAVGEYWVQVTNVNGCAGTDTITINPGALDIDLGADFTYCTVDNPVLDAGTGVAYTYLWSTNATSQTINVTTPGEYWVAVSDGICVGGDTVNATPGTLNIDLGLDRILCDTAGITLDAGPGLAYTYNWSTTAATQTINVTTSGDYWVAVNDGVCTGNDTVSVLYDIPVVELGDGVSNCAEVALNAQNPGATYLWSTGAITPTINVLTDGIYWVEVTSGSGCVATDTVEVLIDGNALDQTIPNVFTPNGDGINDFLTYTIAEVETFDLQIYNRWGELMFESNNEEQVWDGQNEAGNAAPDGTYFWVLTYISTCGEGEQQTVTGTVSVMR